MASSSSTAAASSTMAASPTGLPSGISGPLETISDTDKGGLIAIVAAFALSLMLVSFPIRTYVRSKLGRYKMDDYAFIGASLFAVLQAACVFYELREGLGKTEEQIDTDDDFTSLQKAAYASDILYIVAMFLSKCSTAFLFLRLTPGRGHAFAIWGTISGSIVWAVVSIFLVALRCHPVRPWTDIAADECTGLFARWQFIAALDVITEAALFAISVYLVWGIQMSMKSKAIVVCAFGCRLPVIAIIGLRLYYINIEVNASDIYLLSTNAVSCTQLEIGYSIMASIVPCLKTFMMPYDRELTGPGGASQYRNYAYGNGGSHKLSSLNSSSREGDIVGEQSQEGVGRVGAMFIGKLRPEQTIYEAKVTHVDKTGNRKSVDSGNSRRMIIKKGVEWSVDYDGRTPSPGSKEDDHYTIEEVTGDSHER